MKETIKLDVFVKDGIHHCFLIKDPTQVAKAGSHQNAIGKWIEKFGQANGLEGRCLGVIG